MQRLLDGLVGPLQAERDLERRARIYGFPQQFGALRDVLKEVVDAVFSPSQFEADPLLRGVYFVSGTQEGTPLDRLLGALAQSHGLGRVALPANQGTGKAYFIERLLREVIFAESELGGADLKWERRRHWLAGAGYAAIGLVALLVAGAWAVTYADNRAYVDRVAAGVDEVQRRAAGAPGDLVAMLPLLSTTRELAAAGEPVHGGWLGGTGLDQRGKLDAAASQAYRDLLAHRFLPALLARLASQLQNGSDKPELQYEALKAYRMLHDAKHFDAPTLKAWFAADWNASLPATTTREQRAALDGHLARLLEPGPVVAATPEDRALTARVRSQLAAAPLARRVYDRMRRQDVGAGAPDFTIAKAGGPGAALVLRRASGAPLTEGVPGRFTRDGYKAFQQEVEATMQRLAEEEDWVLGVQDAARSARQLDGNELKRLSDEARKLYLTDYAATWQGFIADIKLVPANDLDAVVQTLRVLTSPESPLKPLLVAISDQTTLGQPSARQSKAVTAFNQAISKSEQLKRELERMINRGKPVPDALPPGAPIEDIVDARFAPLREHVRAADGGKGPAPIDASIKLLDELLATMVAAQQAKLARGPMPPVKPPLVAIERMPEPLHGAVEAQFSRAIAIVNGIGTGQVVDDLRADVGEFCRKAIADRYPVARQSAQDIRPADFATLFAPGGLMDKFFQKHLAGRVDTARRPWTTRPVDGQPAPIDSATLIQFQRAAAIRDTFFPPGSAQPALRLQLAPVGMDASILGFILDVDGQIVRYAHGPSIPSQVQWPGPQGSGQIRLQLTPPPASGPSALTVQGPWALLRLFDTMALGLTDDPSRFRVTFDVGGRKADFDVTASSVLNPFRLRELTEFACPGAR